MNKFSYQIDKTKPVSSHYLYYVWNAMKQRCYNIEDKNYKNYGAKGIKICSEWKNNVNTFFDWAIENGYKKGLTVERIDNKGNYHPGNCKFTNRTGQQRNRGLTVTYTHNGDTKSLSEWAAIFDINYPLLYSRIRKGVPFEKAVLNERISNIKKPFNLEVAKKVGLELKNKLKYAGIKQRWLYIKMNEAGLRITETTLSNKINARGEMFTNEEFDFINKIIKAL